MGLRGGRIWSIIQIIYKYQWENDPMATIREFFQNLLYQVPAIGITDIVDILVVSILF